MGRSLSTTPSWAIPCLFLVLVALVVALGCADAPSGAASRSLGAEAPSPNQAAVAPSPGLSGGAPSPGLAAPNLSADSTVGLCAHGDAYCLCQVYASLLASCGARVNANYCDERRINRLYRGCREEGMSEGACWDYYAQWVAWVTSLSCSQLTGDDFDWGDFD